MSCATGGKFYRLPPEKENTASCFVPKVHCTVLAAHMLLLTYYTHETMVIILVVMAFRMKKKKYESVSLKTFRRWSSPVMISMWKLMQRTKSFC